MKVKSHVPGHRASQWQRRNWDHVCIRPFSHVRLFVTLWTVALQAPLSMGFSRQEYGSGLPCRLSGDRLNPGIEPTSLTSPTLTARFSTTSIIWEAPKGTKMGEFCLWKRECPSSKPVWIWSKNFSEIVPQPKRCLLYIGVLTESSILQRSWYVYRS